jgi:hypothetical protein
VKPEIHKVYPSPKNRPINYALIGEITKGQRPAELRTSREIMLGFARRRIREINAIAAKLAH